MDNALKILIVEDEFITRRYLKNTLKGFGYNVIAEAMEKNEAINILNEQNIELAILDINLGEDDKNGIQIGKYIQEKINIPFIYLTAYSTKAIIKNAITTNPSSYLTKPFNAVDLMAAIEIAIDKYSNLVKKSGNEFILVKDGNLFTKLKIEEIEFLESVGNYIYIYTKNKTYTHRSTLKAILSQIQSNKIIKIHRAFAVNVDLIKQIDYNKITIKDKIIPISRKYKDNIIKIINTK